MSAEIYAVLDGDIALRAADDLADVYREAFAGAPHNESPEAAERFGEAVARHTERPGFRATAAWGPGADLVGFAYGHTTLPGQPWHDRVAPEVAAGSGEGWLADAFVLVNLAVRPRRRREGIGGRLHDLLLETVPHRTAVLSAREDDAAALWLYHGRGWQEIGRGLAFVPGGDPFVILGRNLAGHPGVSLE
jgi:ribosomal protein S18 acetylase RimI-like enzyme